MEDIYFNRVNFANKAKRVPICFCIDTSDSMLSVVEGLDRVRSTGRSEYKDGQNWEIVEGGISLMDKIHEGMSNFYDAILDDDMACDSCESAIVTFSDTPKLYEGFSSVDRKKAPDFHSMVGGETNMSSAIRMALDMLEKQKEYYKNNRIPYFQPWLVLFTDGKPTDDITNIQRELMQLQNANKLSVYAMALTSDQDLFNSLRGFTKRTPIRCSDPKEIKRFFDFLARSVSVTASTGNDIPNNEDVPPEFF